MVEKKLIEAGEVDLPPNFEPWLGPRYEPLNYDDDLWRVHVMGESHYSRPEDFDRYEAGPDLTRIVVADWAMAPSKGGAFFTRVASMVSNKPADELDRGKTWGGIAYSVFVQQLLTGPRQAPDATQWEDARRRFFAQLALTRPAVLVVLGSRHWEQLPWQVGVKAPPFRFGILPDAPVIDDAWVYPFWDQDRFWCTLAIKVTHPSAGYGRWSWEVAARRVTSAMGCYSNVLEHCYDHFVGSGAKPF